MPYVLSDDLQISKLFKNLFYIYVEKRKEILELFLDENLCVETKEELKTILLQASKRVFNKKKKTSDDWFDDGGIQILLKDKAMFGKKSTQIENKVFEIEWSVNPITESLRNNHCRVWAQNQNSAGGLNTLMNYSINQLTFIEQQTIIEDVDDPFTMKKRDKALNNTKLRTSPLPDGILPEILVYWSNHRSYIGNLQFVLVVGGYVLIL